jgi:hypothetical protein
VIRDQELPWSDLAREVIDSLEPLALDKLEEELEALAQGGIELHSSVPPEALNYVLCLALRPVWRLGLSPLPADRQAFYSFNRALSGVMERTLKRRTMPTLNETSSFYEDSALMVRLSKDLLDSILLMRIQKLKNAA